MHLCRFIAADGPHLGLIIGEEVYDLTLIDPARFGSLGSLLTWSTVGAALPEALTRAVAGYRPLAGGRAGLRLLKPIDEQEVWAAGVTYLRSRAARERESQSSDLYSRVYRAARPEIFFKGLPHHCVGPDEPVRVRADSRWSVPEPELALLLNPAGEIVGFTVGNDMSARDIEGENALYLPQAKIYRQGCALGPVIRLAGTGADPSALGVTLRIARGGAVVFEGTTRTSQMARPFADLIAYLRRENDLPRGAFFLTGTGIIPPDDFTLREGDRVTITIEGVGELSNPVVQDHRER